MSLLTVSPHIERWPSAVSPSRILIAEDDEEMRSLLAAVLEQDGYVVDEVGDGGALLERFLDWEDAEDSATGSDGDRPNLIVTDVQMPGCNGLGAISQLRRWNEDIAVIVITAFGDPRTHAQARELGVAAVLDKPFDLLDFRDAVESALECRDLPRDDVA